PPPVPYTPLFRSRPHRPCLDHQGEDIPIHPGSLCDHEPLTHLLLGQLLPLGVRLRVRSQHPSMLNTKPLGPQRRSSQRQPVPQVASQQPHGVRSVLAPVGVHRPPPRKRAIPHLVPGPARLDTTHTLLLQSLHPPSHPLHPGSHRSRLVMTKAGEPRPRQNRQLSTNLPEPFAQLFSSRRDTSLGDQRHPRSPPFGPVSTSTSHLVLLFDHCL